jgi:cytochrome c553
LDALCYEQLIAALKAYRAGSRTNPVMQSVARSLDEAEIEALAAYFSGQP